MPPEKNTILDHVRIAIKGAGEMATGVAVRLRRAGFRRIVMLEIARPLAVRREVSFCEAVYDGRKTVEGIEAALLEKDGDVQAVWESGRIGVVVDPEWSMLTKLSPHVSIDAILAKKNLGANISEAPVVIALGPGFVAGTDAHYVIETNRGHNLGRVMTSGSAEPNTGIPGVIGGFAAERVLRAPGDGAVEVLRGIGEMVKAGDAVCRVGGIPVTTQIDGVVRGMIRDGIEVKSGVKIGDVDPRGKKEYCFTVSEKARALGGSVLEAVCGELDKIV